MRMTLPFGAPLEPVEIVGERVTLRDWSPVDLPTVREAAADGFLRSMTTLPDSTEESEYEAFIDRQIGRAPSGEGWALAITVDPEAPALGHVFVSVGAARKGQVEFGYWMLPSARRQGLMTETLRTATAWAFETLDIHRVNLFIEPWNEASLRTAESVGYVREGLLEQWQLVGGVPKDLYCYRRLRDEFT